MIMSDVNITTSTTTAARRRLGSRWIDDWRPEDGEFWNTIGKTVARRNLTYSVFSEHIGFSIWSIWSVLVLFLGPDYGFDPAQKFLLTAAPTLVGALLRLPYTFAVGKFGGRNWTIMAALLLLVPSIMIAIVLKPGVSLSTLLIVSLFAGVGGGNRDGRRWPTAAPRPSRVAPAALRGGGDTAGRRAASRPRSNCCQRSSAPGTFRTG